MSACPSVNLFSNQIGSLSFHPIFPIFGVSVQNNTAQNVVEVEIWLFASDFLMDLQLQKIGKKGLKNV